MLPSWLRIELDGWEILALIISALLLLPLVREVLFWAGLPNLLSPLFSLREALYSLTELRIQRDELLRAKSHVVVVNPMDTVSYLPVRFKGTCNLLDMEPPAYPERITVRCDTSLSPGDLLWAHGLVGRVLTVLGNSGEVLTLHSREFYIRVVDIRSGVWGTMRGGKTPMVRFLPEVADVKVGDTLMAYDHPGVLVGVVSKIVPEAPFVRLDVQPIWRYYVWTKFALLKPLY